MLDFGANFVAKLPFPAQSATILELIGDVGTGKTTFTRGLARALGVTEPLTSPSFTISKTYALPNGGHLIHYDFYRLPDPGLMADDLAEKLQNPQNLIIIEWGESIQDLLPDTRYTLNFAYNDDDSHEVTIQSPTNPTNQIDQAGQTNKTDQTIQTNRTNQTDQTNPSNPPKQPKEPK